MRRLREVIGAGTSVTRLELQVQMPAFYRIRENVPVPLNYTRETTGQYLPIESKTVERRGGPTDNLAPCSLFYDIYTEVEAFTPSRKTRH